METISRSLVTFLLNSLWQIPLVAAVAWLGCRALRRSPASHLHAVWVAALAAAILLPLASLRSAPPASTQRITILLPSADLAPAPAAVAAETPSRPAPRTVPFTS